MMAMRALKRRLLNVIYARMINDQNRRTTMIEAGPGGHSGTTPYSSATDLTPDVGSSEATSRTRRAQAENRPRHCVLTERSHESAVALNAT